MLKSIHALRDRFEERLSRNLRRVEQPRKFVQETFQRAEDSVIFFFREITTLSEIEDELGKCTVFKHSETCCLRQHCDKLKRDCAGKCAGG